jgi:hypothetical protein
MNEGCAMSVGSFRNVSAAAVLGVLAGAALPAAAAPINTTVEAIGSIGFGAKAGSTVFDFNAGLPSDPHFSAAGSAFGLYTGTLAGTAATPFGDSSQYYSTGLGSTTITFDETTTYLGFLWGSVDGYNSIQFYDGDTLIGTIGGASILNPANGDQGIGGTFYVNFEVAGGFDRVKLISNGFSFEIDDLAYGANYEHQIPEPATGLLLGAGLVAMGYARRRRA